jgi:hypothetical protein
MSYYRLMSLDGLSSHERLAQVLDKIKAKYFGEE